MSTNDGVVWRQADSVLVKTTGFPYELVESLRDERIATLVTGDADPNAVRAVVEDNVRTLLKLADTPRLREAILLSSEPAFQVVQKLLTANVDPAALRSKDRARIRTLTMYVQRLCAKNESTSFFGPVYWARFGSGSGLDVDTRGEPPRCEVFWSHWAVSALGFRMAADPEVAASIVPRRPPWLFEDGTGTRRVAFIEHPITVHPVEQPPPGSAAARLLAVCDGEHTAAACAVALEQPVDQVVPMLRDLHARSLVVFDLDPPTGLLDPFEHLLEFTRGLPARPRTRWLAVLTDLDRLRRAFATATGLDARAEALTSVKARFTVETGASADRHAGQIAVDRTILVEDGTYRWRTFDIGGGVADYLRDRFPPILDLTFELSLARRRARAAVTEEWFRTRFGVGRTVTLDRALAAAEENDHALARRLRQVDDEVRRTGPSALSDALFSDPTLTRIERDLDWARENAALMEFDTWCVCGVDMFLATDSTDAANEGRFQLVLGEVHGLHDQLVQGLWPHLHPDPDGLAEQVGGLVAGISEATICDPTLPHQRKTMARLSALPEVEFGCFSPRPRDRRVRAADLLLSERDGALVLHGAPLGPIALTRPPLWWWSDEAESLFAPFTGARLANMEETVRPCPDITHLPRLTVDRTVAHRETWWLPPTEAGRRWTNLAPGNQVAAWRLKDRIGLPDQVFVKFAEEPKPLFIDFTAPLLVDLFCRCLHHASAPAVVTEMLPGPDQLWLRDERGRYPCELRFGYYRPADARPVP